MCFSQNEVFKFSAPAPFSGLFDILAWSISVMRNVVESLTTYN